MQNKHYQLIAITLFILLLISIYVGVSKASEPWKQPSDTELKEYLPPNAENIHYIGNKYWTFTAKIDGKYHKFLYCLQISPNYSIGAYQVTQGSITDICCKDI